MSSATSASPAPAPVDAPVKETKAKATKKAAAAPKAAAPKKKAPASKAASSHPTWKEIIKECIVATGGRQGVSRSALKKFAEDQYGLDATPAHVSLLNRALASLVEDGECVLPKGPSGCVKLASKTPRDSSKENAKPVSKTTAKAAPAKKLAGKPKAAAATKPAATKAKKAVVGKKAVPAAKKAAAAKPRSAPKPRTLVAV
ncbi:hypothetical protein B0H12DRAFT_1228379 [Mycena haematopus]|nr:hypothetical protein B0H12DRAFT_1228379 [Mycena haematopus]